MTRSEYHAARRTRGQVRRSAESRRAALAYADWSALEAVHAAQSERSVAHSVPVAYCQAQSLSNGRFAARRHRVLELIAQRRWQQAKGFSVEEVNRELRRTFHCWRDDVGPTRAPVPLPGDTASPRLERR